MKPYYDQGGITIYHGDCLEVLKGLEDDSIAVALTDPPWELSGSQIEIRGAGVAPRKQASKTLKTGAVGEWSPAPLNELERVVAGDRFILAGYKELGKTCEMAKPLRGVFVWHKPNGAPALTYPTKMDVSYIVWTGKKSALYGFQHWKSMIFSFPFPQAGCMASERFVDGSGKAVHPCQGPLALYLDLLRPFTKETTIIDPFMGTGTTLRAAKDLGMKAIGIERDEAYCKLAVSRMHQEILFS